MVDARLGLPFVRRFDVVVAGQDEAKVGSADEAADFCVERWFDDYGGAKVLTLTFTPLGWRRTGASAAASGGDAPSLQRRAYHSTANKLQQSPPVSVSNDHHDD